jgi:glycerol-1-phosphate dehydrogenase [NAD(P)+]
MELPRKILIGEKVISEVGSFLRSIEPAARRVAIVSGKVVRSRAGNFFERSLRDAGFAFSWLEVNDSSMQTVTKLQDKILDGDTPEVVIGLGGGRSVDLAKMAAFKASRPFVSVPTSASHDGISSPFVSVRGAEKPYSIKANTPIGVLADIDMLSKAPPRLLASGCGDLVAKITAVKDWELARNEKGEYFGSYAANLASLSANIILDESAKLSETNAFSVRTIVEALISAGVASCIAGSSRPCSGAEHLFSHALEYIAGSECGLHGERVGLGTIMMAKLHDMEWKRIRDALSNVGAPTSAKQIGVREEHVVKALTSAQSLRPERYTILSKMELEPETARELAKSVCVI